MNSLFPFLHGMALAAIAATLTSTSLAADAPPRALRDLNTSYFPMTPVKSREGWAARHEEIRRRVLLASGLWPMPDRTPLNAMMHGRAERDDYTIDRVFFESLPGHFVTGSLYLPRKQTGKMPGILCPHGHWPDGRFMDRGAGTPATKKEIDTKAEKLECAARSPLQARCVQLARMGCAVFHYDMIGYADSAQFCDASGKPLHRHGVKPELADSEAGTWGFVSPQAELHLQGYFGLQTWNSVRALDFLLSLPGIDSSRIGCTGASGGGTQTMMIAGVDDRITAAFPCVMVSTAMQGGCTCENSHYLRINQGNIDIAALTAPRPLGLTAADDWTKELETKGLPDLKNLYAMLGVPDHLTAHIATQFPHNYNLPSRAAMYRFYNKHFKLGLAAPIEERDFTVSSREELTVWTSEHPKPGPEACGDAHERAVCRWMASQDEKHITGPLISKDDSARNKAREIVQVAWEMILGRLMPAGQDVAFELGKKEDRGSYLFMDGTTRYTPASEDIACTFLYPKDWKGTAALWLSLDPNDLFVGGANPAPTAAARKLLDAGVAIARPALYLSDSRENPKVGYGLKAKAGDFGEYGGYFYGYNPGLFVQRVRDAMTMVTMMRNHPNKPAHKVIIMGAGGAGAIAAAAGAMSRNLIDGASFDLEGFRFGSLKSAWDHQFVPGATKYGDVDGLIALNSPDMTIIHGKESKAGAEAVAESVVELSN